MKAKISQCYIGRESDVERCRVSLQSGTSITIYALAEDIRFEAFTGTVQSLEDGEGSRVPHRRWRVTMK